MLKFKIHYVSNRKSGVGTGNVDWKIHVFLGNRVAPGGESNVFIEIAYVY